MCYQSDGKQKSLNFSQNVDNEAGTTADDTIYETWIDSHDYLYIQTPSEPAQEQDLNFSKSRLSLVSKKTMFPFSPTEDKSSYEMVIKEENIDKVQKNSKLLEKSETWLQTHLRLPPDLSTFPRSNFNI